MMVVGMRMEYGMSGHTEMDRFKLNSLEKKLEKLRYKKKIDGLISLKLG